MSGRLGDYTNVMTSLALVTGQLEKAIKKIGDELETLFGNLDEDLLKLQ